MTVLTGIAFAIGVVALVGGADSLVRGAARIAARTGLSAVVIGLTVVAFGTSAPELAVSIGAAINDSSDIALGNVIGSNIANILLVLGLSAVAGGGLFVAFRIVRTDVPIMIGLSVALLVLGIDGSIGRIDGAIFVVALIAYVTWTVTSTRREASDTSDLDHDGVSDSVELADQYTAGLDEDLSGSTPLWRDLLAVLAGLVLLVVGAQMLVAAATDIAEAFGVSELVIGLTVVAIGTSLPELATSVVAAARGQRDLAVGNAIGSNLFNILAVIGIASLVSPIRVSDGALGFDLPFMLAVAVACLPMFVNGFELKRWEGGLFVAYYVAYLVWLGLDAAEHGLEPTFSVAMFGFVVPLTVITLVIVGFKGFAEYRRGDVTPSS
ncbi:MAG: calcium/sodium antiporter [Actinomycetota bacterium]|nr:calcium/sodium antiporter [Actinomycetota bacterium]MDA3015114.1 calcium/sodium antiporter [Actinomycetota bacterium]MDA3027580.1 calcium/sodium antiporter [Actinomycetota bacterium]